MSSNYTYQFAFVEGVETVDAELIELHVRMVSTGNEYVINIVGELEPVEPEDFRPKSGPPLPTNVLLSLLGGGNYSKIKRVRSRRKISSN